MDGLNASPYITKIKSMKELADFTEKHKRCMVMFSMKGCLACDMALPHLVAAAEKYHKKLWLGYIDIHEVGVNMATVPFFQCFFEGYKIYELVEKGYSQDGLNDLMERLWLTKVKATAEKTETENSETQN
jgi:hypothetical protein